jgi:hypothetical protein
VRPSGRTKKDASGIARKANVCLRSVATAIQRLKELGVLNWVRRCAENWIDGRFVLEQDTNALVGRRMSPLNCFHLAYNIQS